MPNTWEEPFPSCACEFRDTGPARRRTLGNAAPERGGAFLPDTRQAMADHLADPGEPWRIVAGRLSGGIVSTAPRNLGA
ncbi:hypothetical protein SCOCK_170144 [Actinacidiphila cocklensis]|uniref:Uncharacterized protein n=1 Tax=Actinacidiphila cocklensis TaxID=887465 RepID=A0A9W4DS92_9ACTN|nr:hypothetical protein SCOCK_170144 [Actinacidiphila cocklensis]